MDGVDTGLLMLGGYLAAGIAAKVLGGQWRRRRHQTRWNDVQRTLRQLAVGMRGEAFDDPILPDGGTGRKPYLGTWRRYGQARVPTRGLTAIVGANDHSEEPDDGQTWIRITRPADRAWVCQSLRLRSRPPADADHAAEAVFRACFAVAPRDAVPVGARVQLMALAAQASGIQLEPQDLLVIAAPASRTRHLADPLQLRALIEQAAVAVELLSGKRRDQLAAHEGVDAT